MSEPQKIVIDGYSPSKAAFAQYLVRTLALQDIYKVPREELPPQIIDIPKFPAKSPPGSVNVKPADLKIGIIGAGIAGLYTALILDFLEIKYEILEANPNRVGGRLYTHYFGKPQDGNNQYYDIGAMRFPKSPIMVRTFDLMARTKTDTGKYIMTWWVNPLKSVVWLTMFSDTQPMRYNDITKILPKDDKWNDDPFKVSTQRGGPVPIQTVQNPDEILNDAYFPYRRKIKRALNAYVEHDKKQPHDDKWHKDEQKLLEDLERAWNYLMQHDKFSLRDYLSFVEGLDDESIHWLETLNVGTGWFDEAFTENVIDSLAFDYKDTDDTKDKVMTLAMENDIEWHYIKDGTYKLTMNTLKMLKTKPEQDKLVTGMTLSGTTPEDHRIQVTVRNEANPRTYDTVFCSTTFGAMQKMDLTGLKLPYGMKAAIRSLRYDASTKVAIQFKDPWWIKSDKVKAAGGLTNIEGGLGKTDMPLRTCVYPSYNLKDEGDAVLLCSYTWGSDSERIASMINPVSTKDDGTNSGTASAATDPESLLKETMIDNLARLHSTTEDSYKAMKKIIADSYKAHHAYDWTKDPYTCGGAFALFSPAQFRTLYPNIVRPAADSRLHVIGEAASAHHAWIVGALDSSVRGVYLMLERFKLEDLQKKLLNGFGPIGEVDEKTAHFQVALGMVNRKLLA